jgi:hypothetical protein
MMGSGTTSGNAPAVGDGLFYSTINPLLAQYHTYFNGTAPIEQPTMAQIGTLLNEQAAWATANASQVTGSIQGNVVTISNGGAAIELPLTGTEVGSPYAGSHSGWVLAPAGTSTHTALVAWPAVPTVPVMVTVPGGPAPGTGPTKLPGAAPKPVSPHTSPTFKLTIASVVSQVAPKTVRIKHGNKVTVSLKCKAAKGALCTGKFTLKVKGNSVTVKFRIKAGKIARLAVGLPKAAVTASHNRHHKKMFGTLVISTTQSHHKKAKLTHGKLTIKT